MAPPSTVPVEARSYELDPYGHLNNAVYVNWLEHGRLCFLRDRGQTFSSIPADFRVQVVVVRTDVAYKAQVRLGDRLRVTTVLARTGRTSFAFAQTIAFEDGRVAATADVTMVCVGEEGTPVPIPDGLRALLSS